MAGSTYSYGVRVMDEVMVLALATKFQKWRINRLLKGLNPEQLLIYKNILHYRVDVTGYRYDVADYGYSDAPLSPTYIVYVYTRIAKYRLCDDVVLSYYPIPTYSGNMTDSHDSFTNQWYSAGEKIEWSAKLYKLIKLYNRIVYESDVAIAKINEENAFKEKLKELE